MITARELKMRFAKRDRERKEWEQRNAALFADQVAEQLEQSLAHVKLSSEIRPLEIVDLENRAIERDDAIARIIARKLRDGDNYASIDMERADRAGQREDERAQASRERAPIKPDVRR